MSGGDFVLPKIGGAFVRGGFCPGGLLSGGDFVQGGFCPGLVSVKALKIALLSTSRNGTSQRMQTCLNGV